VLLVSNGLVEMMHSVGQGECWTKMTSGCGPDIQGFRSLTQTFGETVKTAVQLAQRPGDTLKERDHKLQSLRLAHVVVGG